MSKKVVIGIVVFICVIIIALGALIALIGIGTVESNIDTETNDQEISMGESNNNGDSQDEQEVEFSMGEWNGSVYSNDFLGLKYTMPEGWTYSSDEEIAEMMDVGVELLNDEQKVAAELSKLTSVYYMVTNEPSTGSSVSLLSEKSLKSVTIDYYMQQIKTQLENLDSMNYEIGESSKETVANKEFDTLTVTVPDYGITQKYYTYKMDEYFISIILTSTQDEAHINDMIKCFEQN